MNLLVVVLRLSSIKQDLRGHKRPRVEEDDTHLSVFKAAWP
jgi:hypothetical protein